MAPGADERQPEALPTFQEKHSLRLLRTIRENSDIIVGQFYGHLHSDTFRVIYNDLGEQKFIIISNIITPQAFNKQILSSVSSLNRSKCTHQQTLQTLYTGRLQGLVCFKVPAGHFPFPFFKFQTKCTHEIHICAC